jgi:redox-sensitive bicupin YhaK (pirin superfamily)
MITKIEKENLYTSDHGWLQSKFLFSFAEYYDNTNLEWGTLRVFNDDTIAPHSGFPMHSHSEMEIVTFMFSGSLTHKDSMGNTRTITRGYVQRMSAGTGVTHSEMNNGNEAVTLFQLWFYPHTKHLTPSYEEKEFSHLENNGLHLLVSNDGSGGSLSFSSHATIMYGFWKENETYTLPMETSDHVLIYIRKGSMIVNDVELSVNDQLRVVDEKELTFVSKTSSECIIILS